MESSCSNIQKEEPALKELARPEFPNRFPARSPAGSGQHQRDTNRPKRHPPRPIHALLPRRPRCTTAVSIVGWNNDEMQLWPLTPAWSHSWITPTENKFSTISYRSEVLKNSYKFMVGNAIKRKALTALHWRRWVRWGGCRVTTTTVWWLQINHRITVMLLLQQTVTQSKDVGQSTGDKGS